MTKPKYFNRNGDEISEAETLDHRGMMRDQVTIRVSTMVRDSEVTRDSAVGFHDGSGNPWSASRPGFRVRASDDRSAVRDAYAEYETRLVNQPQAAPRTASMSRLFGLWH
jgi:hypothetical protein